MNRDVTMTADGKPKLTRQAYCGEENVLCMEITAIGGMGGGVQVFVPVADESDALEWKKKIEQEDQIGAANLLKAMMVWEERDRLEATGAQDDVAPIAPAPSQPAPMTVAENRASMTPAAAAKLAAALAQIRQDEIQAGWKKAAQHVAGQGKSTLSSSWARTVAKFTAEHDRKFRRNQ